MWLVFMLTAWAIVIGMAVWSIGTLLKEEAERENGAD